MIQRGYVSRGKISVSTRTDRQIFVKKGSQSSYVKKFCYVSRSPYTSFESMKQLVMVCSDLSRVQIIIPKDILSKYLKINELELVKKYQDEALYAFE